MSRRWDGFQAEDYRARPNRRGSRPRTKERPQYHDAVTGMVIGVDRGRYTVVLDEGVEVTCVRASRLRKTSIVPGDRVQVVGDTSGKADTLARIVLLADRHTVLRRSADDSDPTERVLVANADQLVIVTATADPAPSPGFLDRTLTAAFDADITPLIAVTKTDLAPSAQLRQRFADVDVELIDCRMNPDGSIAAQQLAQRLRGHINVLIGHSGVGKSTLTNALVPGAARATGHVNEVTGRGRHTSSSAVCLPLTGGGWLIDTPGVRSFGLAHVDPDNVLAAFADLAQAAAECPKGCPHLSADQGCQLDAWVAAGNAGPAGVQRLASLRRLLGNLAKVGP